MELDKIRALAQMMEEYNLEELRLGEGGDKITLRKAAGTAEGLPAVSVARTAPAAEIQESAAVSESGAAIPSPMVGVFYAASSPEVPPFVTLGQTVKTGDVICIIEAMKLMNEITAEQDGTIIEICAKNGDLVEFGQPLFRIEA